MRLCKSIQKQSGEIQGGDRSPAERAEDRRSDIKFLMFTILSVAILVISYVINKEKQAAIENQSKPCIIVVEKEDEIPSDTECNILIKKAKT